MKYLTYDIEATFLQKGGKRSMTKLLEIALYNSTISFQRLVNPLTKYKTGQDIIDNLHELSQHPENTLNFWTKLLIEKKGLKSNVKRMKMINQATQISKLLVRSDIARKYKDSEQMLFALERNNDDEEEAKKNVRRGDVGNSLLFYTADEALAEALQVGADHLWIAHNGRAFDSKVLQGHTKHDWSSVSFHDSLPLFKSLLPNEDSYSQPLLFKSVFKGKSYFAHHALEDAMALHKLVEHVVGDKDIFEEFLNVEKHSKKIQKKPHQKSTLYDIKGVGAKSVVVFHKHNITTKKELLEFVEKISYEDWCKTFKQVHQYKKLWERLNDVYKDTAVV